MLYRRSKLLPFTNYSVVRSIPFNYQAIDQAEDVQLKTPGFNIDQRHRSVASNTLLDSPRKRSRAKGKYLFISTQRPFKYIFESTGKLVLSDQSEKKLEFLLLSQFVYLPVMTRTSRDHYCEVFMAYEDYETGPDKEAIFKDGTTVKNYDDLSSIYRKQTTNLSKFKLPKSGPVEMRSDSDKTSSAPDKE